ncbi:MAG TPA: hypothetical protein VL049_10975 [Candidatus Dormibacteraeota bacterium]|nr:hypothetical protein [Candidatus Dormibacteraeota bacterium]
MREMIEQQLAALPPSALDVLAADHERVEAVCEREARRGQFLRPLGGRELPDGTISERYGFVHALHRDVLARRLASARRVALHHRLGEWLEASGAHPAEVARHFHDGAEAGGAAKAVQHSLRAGGHGSSPARSAWRAWRTSWRRAPD